MVVTFYKTKLSANNRCYDKAAYESYLQGCEPKKVTIEHDIIPNANFYLSTISATDKWQLYNYITFEYAGLKYGSFILSIQPLATDGTIEVRHTTDNWYYVKVNELNVDFHGQCVRAHVNDLKKVGNNYVSDLSNTLIKAEEQVSSQGYKYVTKSLNPENYQYLYITINNPSQTGIKLPSNFVAQRFFSKITESLPKLTRSALFTQCPQLVICGILGVNGIVTFQFINEGDTPSQWDTITQYNTRIQNIQWEGITNMIITNIPPCPMKEVKVITDTQNVIVGYVGVMKTGDFIGKNSVEFTDLAGLPNKCYCPTTFTYCPFDFSIEKVDYSDTEVNNTLKLYDKDTIIYPSETFENYINNGIVKLHSCAYNPMYYCGDLIDYSKLKTKYIDNESYITINLQVSLDLNSIWSIIESDIVDERSSFKVINSTTDFLPTVQRSYFDKYNLTLAGLNASKKITNASFDVANAAIGTVSSFVGGLTNPKKLASAITGTIQGGVNTARATINLDYTKKIENLTLEKTQGQITNGKISTDTPIGYYANQTVLDYNNFKFVKVNNIGFKQLYPLLHRYGYNTVLQLDEIYTNHRRKYFNYIQTEDCDVNGVPLDIANDLENMFNAGVHLWSGKVEEWEVANWQRNGVEVQNV